MTSEQNEAKASQEPVKTLTSEQVIEQIAAYHRLYQKLRKEHDPDQIKKKNEKEREQYHKNKAKQEPENYKRHDSATQYMILKSL